jgi:effector-binding domain-containing protein
MRKWILGCAVLVIGVLSWYLFLKPDDFSVSFKAKTLPEIVVQSVKIWTTQKNGVIDQLGERKILQRIPFKNDSLTYQWNIKQLTDSTSRVKVSVKDKNISLIDRFKIPLLDTNYEKDVSEDFKAFLELLNSHLDNIRVKITGISDIDSTYCAYVPLKEKQVQKAKGMMENFSLLSIVLASHNVQLNGHPFIEITRWDKDSDSIYYNFCYPIIKNDSLPQHPEIKYKQFDGKKAIKAIYNGNYMTSDRAWYFLENYARKNKIEITDTPIEVFVNNPNMGGNELEWETIVYLPLKQ